MSEVNKFTQNLFCFFGFALFSGFQVRGNRSLVGRVATYLQSRDPNTGLEFSLLSFIRLPPNLINYRSGLKIEKPRLLHSPALPAHCRVHARSQACSSTGTKPSYRSRKSKKPQSSSKSSSKLHSMAKL